LNKQNLSFADVFRKGAVIFNPVLIQLVGLCPVVAASTSFLNAVMLSFVLCAELCVTCVIASACFKNVPRWIRVALYMAIGLVMICPILYYIDNYTLINLSFGTQIYLPLIAVNSVTAVHCEQFAVKNNVKLAFFDALAVSIGVSVIFIVTGAVREILGNSTFAGMEIDLPVTFKGMSLPFGCLIMLGFLAAGLKTFNARFGLKEEEEEPDESEIAEEMAEPYAEGISVPEVEEVPVNVEELTDDKAVYDDFNDFLKSLDLDRFTQREEDKE